VTVAQTGDYVDECFGSLEQPAGKHFFEAGIMRLSVWTCYLLKSTRWRPRTFSMDEVEIRKIGD
jgi:hypothetical protein